MAIDTSWPRIPEIDFQRAIVPKTADGQSADGSDSLQVSVLFLKAGLRVAPAAVLADM